MEQSLLLGAFFWGYFITTLPGGALSELFGGRRVVGISLGLSGLLTALTPLAAEWSFWAVYAVRVITGLLGVSDKDHPRNQIEINERFNFFAGCFLSIAA